MTELQNCIEGFGFGISAKELAEKAYRHLDRKGYEVSLLNDRYLEVNETRYFFSKSRKHGRWIAKAW